MHVHRGNKNLTKGYLLISIISPLKLKEILDAVKNTIRKLNPDYDIVIKDFISTMI